MSDDKKLAQLRVDIDALDNQLIDLISDRARLAQEVAEVKNASPEPANFYRPEREAQILKKVIEQNKVHFLKKRWHVFSVRSCRLAWHWNNNWT